MKPNIFEQWMNVDPNENALLTTQDQYSKNRLVFNLLEGLDRITGALPFETQ